MSLVRKTQDREAHGRFQTRECRAKGRLSAAPENPNRKSKQSDGREDEDCGFDALKEREPLGGLIGLQDLNAVVVPAPLQIEASGYDSARRMEACIGDLVELVRADAVAMHVDWSLVANQPGLSLAGDELATELGCDRWQEVPAREQCDGGSNCEEAHQHYCHRGDGPADRSSCRDAQGE